MAICTRTGCGKTFDENNNNAGECMFHPGGKSSPAIVKQVLIIIAPVFHEGLKG
jgi:hypothetical protein